MGVVRGTLYSSSCCKQTCKTTIKSLSYEGHRHCCCEWSKKDMKRLILHVQLESGSKKQQLCPNLTVQSKTFIKQKNGTVSVAPRKSPVFRGSPNFPPHAWPTPAHAAGATGTTGGLGAKFAPRAAEAPLDESHPWIPSMDLRSQPTDKPKLYDYIYITVIA